VRACLCIVRYVCVLRSRACVRRWKGYGGGGNAGSGASWRSWSDRLSDDDPFDSSSHSAAVGNDTAAIARRREATAAGRLAGVHAVAAERARWAGGRDLSTVRVSYAELEACARVTNKLLAHYASQPLYAHEEVVDSGDVAFLMVTTNDTKLQEKLDGIRVARQKFVCLNDNLKHEDSHSRKVRARASVDDVCARSAHCRACAGCRVITRVLRGHVPVAIGV
jgi:hypothetical protein